MGSQDTQGGNTPGDCTKEGGDWVCGEEGPAGITRCWCDMADPDPHDDPKASPAYEPQPQPWRSVVAPTLRQESAESRP